MLSDNYNSSLSGPTKLGYEPTEDEIKAIKLAEYIFDKAKIARKKYDSKWLDNYKMFRGMQWKDARPSYRHSEVINLIFRAIQSDVPVLTDAMPKIEFIPTEPQDFEIANILNDIVSSDWDRNNWSYKITECLYDAHMYGTGFGAVAWDQELDHGVGGIEFKSVDPFDQYPDKSSFDVNENSSYYAEATPVNIEKLKLKYPDVAEYLKADMRDITKTDKDMSNSELLYSSATDNVIYERTSSYNSNCADDALEITCYIKDIQTTDEESKSIGADGAEKIDYIKKLKYPNGRKIVVVSGVLCVDEPIQYEDAKFPYLKLSNYVLPREFWGMSEVEQLESPQKIFNKLLSFSLDILTMTGNPIWIVDTNSGVDAENLINRPGLIVEKEPGSEVRREAGGDIQPSVLQMIDRL